MHIRQRLSETFESSEPREIIAWAVAAFEPRLVVSSSFQMQSLPLLHMIANTAPQLPILFLDTGYHFQETLLFRDQIVAAWGLNLRIVRASGHQPEAMSQYGGQLYKTNPDLCCYINKVEPMKKALADAAGWISGVRRDQSTARSDLEIIEDSAHGVVRIHPLANWTKRDIWRYINEHDLPEHPLLVQGYLSVGCLPCTRPVATGEAERDGRWAGQDKNECGLHTDLRQANRADSD